jgi:cysteine desulfurase/selenocysteine lyase
MYGPMGIGVLAGRRTALGPARTRCGWAGDMVEWVSETHASFAELPARLEGGTPNVAGAVGLAAAADFIDEVGRARIDAHVRALRSHAARACPHCRACPCCRPRPWTPPSFPSPPTECTRTTSAPCSMRAALPVRTGHHCAQPLLDCLGVGPTTRASFAVYNSHEEVERLVDALAPALEMLR